MYIIKTRFDYATLLDIKIPFGLVSFGPGDSAEQNLPVDDFVRGQGEALHPYGMK